MSETTQMQEEKVFDPAAENRFEYSVTEDGQRYDVAHVFDAVSDERYLQYLNEFKISGDEDDVKEEGREASVRLWDELISRVDGIKYDDDTDWRSFFPANEKIQGVADLLAVAIDDGSDAPASGPRTIGPKIEQTVITECMSNGDVLRQKHVLRVPTFELEKKYARIAGKRFKREQTRGFRKKTTVTYIPQDKAFGELYDEMAISTYGFVGNVVPLRFKTAVMHYVFASKLEPKSLGK